MKGLDELEVRRGKGVCVESIVLGCNLNKLYNYWVNRIQAMHCVQLYGSEEQWITTEDRKFSY